MHFKGDGSSTSDWKKPLNMLRVPRTSGQLLSPSGPSRTCLEVFRKWQRLCQAIQQASLQIEKKLSIHLGRPLKPHETSNDLDTHGENLSRIMNIRFSILSTCVLFSYLFSPNCCGLLSSLHCSWGALPVDPAKMTGQCVNWQSKAGLLGLSSPVSDSFLDLP